MKIRSIRLRAPLAVLCCLSFMTATDATGGGDGAAVFSRWCAGCHSDTPFSPGTVALRATRGDAGAVIENRRDLTSDYVENIVRKGRAGMPSFRRTEISDDELGALATYLSTREEGQP